MPKKMALKSQAKKQNPIYVIPIFNYFLTLKKVSCKQIYNYYFFLHALSIQ